MERRFQPPDTSPHGRCPIDGDGALDDLTGREREALDLIAQGLSNAAIGDRLHIGLRTVETHVGTIFGKLGLLPDEGEERRVMAAIRYLRGAG